MHKVLRIADYDDSLEFTVFPESTHLHLKFERETRTVDFDLALTQISVENVGLRKTKAIGQVQLPTMAFTKA